MSAEDVYNGRSRAHTQAIDNNQAKSSGKDPKSHIYQKAASVTEHHDTVPAVDSSEAMFNSFLHFELISSISSSVNGSSAIPQLPSQELFYPK